MEIHSHVLMRAQGRVGRALRDKYTLHRLIGVGGTAAVYEATHRNGMRVAVKVLHPEIAEDANAKRRFLREGYIANRIDHPGVVRILDDDEDADGTTFISMELLRGRTLDDERTPGVPFGVERSIDVVSRVLDVLAAAHRAKIVHRDVTPANVFLVHDGAVKVLDFGIARLLDHPRTTPTGDAMGTAEFVAPEQARGRNGEIDARSDVYAAGAILFTLLTGRYVHSTKNPLERLVLAATTSAPAIRSAMPGLSDDLAHVVDIALSFERGQRWESAGAMRQALREAVAS
jgi:serine/threonine-protein kinase